MDIKFNERELKALEFIQPLTENTPHSQSTLFDHLYNTFIILKTMGCSEEVCLAGLYHSVYGTEYFKHKTLEASDEIREYVGEYGENLVKLFCSENRDYMIMGVGNPTDLPPPVLLDLLFIHFANTYEMNPESRALQDIEEYIAEVSKEVKGLLTNDTVH